MNGLLAVSIPDAEAEALSRAVATLPSLFRREVGVPEAVGLTGAGDWVERACDAVSGGVGGVLVTDPSAADVAALRRVASAMGSAVVLDRGWASSPAVARVAPEFAEHASASALVESRIDAPSTSSLADVLLRQLALLRAAVGAVSSLQILRRDRTGYDALGTLEGGTELSLAGVLSDALPEAALVRMVRQEVTVRLELDEIGRATPGVLRVLRGAVETYPLMPFETPHREAWRRLHRKAGSAHVAELDAFAQDVDVLRCAFDAERSGS